MPPAAGTSMVRAMEGWPGFRLGGGAWLHPGLLVAVRVVVRVARRREVRRRIFNHDGLGREWRWRSRFF